FVRRCVVFAGWAPPTDLGQRQARWAVPTLRRWRAAWGSRSSQRRVESQRRGLGVSAGVPHQPARRRVLRRPTSALTTAILGTALMVPDLPAQQLPPTGASPAATAPSPVTPTMLARGARYLLRNGWDYINYQEYERALSFLREAETRKAELN